MPLLDHFHPPLAPRRHWESLPPATALYGIAYRPIVRDGRSQVEIWPHTLEVGGRLPVLPLAPNAETVLPLDLEATYTVACPRRRLA